MFSGAAELRFALAWVDAEGQAHPYAAGDELWGHARGYLAPERPHRAFYGLGAARAQLRAYLEHLLRRVLPPAARSVRASLWVRRAGATLEQHEIIEVSR